MSVRSLQHFMLYHILYPPNKTTRRMTDLNGFFFSHIPSLITLHKQHTHKHLPCVI